MDLADVILMAMGRCPNCERIKASIERFGFLYQTFSWEHEGRFFAWDIHKATKFIKPEGIVEIEPESLASLVGCNLVYPPHVGHVGSGGCGIAIPSQVFPGTFHLGDGNHRAAKCLREGRPFSVFLLTEEQGEQCRIDVKNQAELEGWMEGTARAMEGENVRKLAGGVQ